MSDNPLKKHFRKPAIYVRLPTQGLWYNDGSVDLTEDGEVAVYAMSAMDDIMLNTPDAMLNGKSLESVIKNCVPDVKNIKKLMLPDLNAIFVGLKCATNNGKHDIDKTCPNCKFENTFEMNCFHLLENCTFIEQEQTVLNFDNDLVVHLKPYDFERRQLFIKQEFEEDRLIRHLEVEYKDSDEFVKSEIAADSVSRISQMTFDLVSKSIVKIDMTKENLTVTDSEHIKEWLMSISFDQANIVIDTVNKMNEQGVPKKLPITCTSCGHDWEDSMSFDPINFFAKRSSRATQ